MWGLLLVLLLLTAPVQAAPGRHARQIQILQAAVKHQPARALRYRFVLAGDNRDGNAVFMQILRHASTYKPAFMLHSGDFVPLGRKAEYRQLLALLDQVRFPVFLAMGNHDAYQGGERWYRTFLGSPDDYFDYGPDRFVLLNNAAGQLTSQQLQWLDRILSAPRRHRFVVMHYPPQSLIWFHAFAQGAAELRKIVIKHRVQAVLMGHMHIYDSYTDEGVRWIVSGGAGAPLYRMPLYFSAEGGAFPHFVAFDVTPRGVQETVVRLR